jgi:hypothetical protein
LESRTLHHTAVQCLDELRRTNCSKVCPMTEARHYQFVRKCASGCGNSHHDQGSHGQVFRVRMFGMGRDDGSVSLSACRTIPGRAECPRTIALLIDPPSRRQAVQAGLQAVPSTGISQAGGRDDQPHLNFSPRQLGPCRSPSMPLHNRRKELWKSRGRIDVQGR